MKLNNFSPHFRKTRMGRAAIFFPRLLSRRKSRQDSPPGQEGWIQTERSECLETGWWRSLASLRMTRSLTSAILHPRPLRETGMGNNFPSLPEPVEGHSSFNSDDISSSHYYTLPLYSTSSVLFVAL